MVFYEGLGLHWFQDTENQNSTHQDTLWLYEASRNFFQKQPTFFAMCGQEMARTKAWHRKIPQRSSMDTAGTRFWKALLSVPLISIIEVAKLHCIVRRGAPSISVRSQAHCQGCKTKCEDPNCKTTQVLYERMSSLHQNKHGFWQTWLLLSYQSSRYSKDDWGSMKRLERWCSRPATFSIFFTHMWYELIKVINTRQINLISFTKHSPVQGLCHALIEEAMSARETSNPIGTRATAADLCCN